MISATHPTYNGMVRSWSRCRDAAAGPRAIKDAGTTYLPPLKGQSEVDYQKYKGRALWFGATGRTIDGLTGAVFRKDPVISVPDDGMATDFSDVTLDGTSLSAFAKELLTEVLTVGRGGILIDYPEASIDEKGKWYQAPGARPYWIRYSAEQVVNWQTERVGGREVLKWVTLKETTLEPSEEGSFQLKYRERYRLLEMLDGRYQQVVYTQNDRGEWLAGRPIVPMIGSKPFDSIPFIFVGPKGTGTEICEPPILALVETNISHYLTSADLENGRHYAGLPQMVVMGAESTMALEIGSSTAWMLPMGADAKYVEFQGAGLGELRMALEEKQKMMAAIGARLLEDPKRGVEAADSIRLRTSGETASLQSMALSVSRALTLAAQWHARWTMRNPAKVDIRLNSDVVDARLSGDELMALMTLFQGNAISFDTLFHQLQKGEIIPATVTAEEELTRIRALGDRAFDRAFGNVEEEDDE